MDSHRRSHLCLSPRLQGSRWANAQGNPATVLSLILGCFHERNENWNIYIYIKTFNDLMFMKSYQEIAMAWNRAGNVYLVKSSFASTECLPLFGNQISPQFVPIKLTTVISREWPKWPKPWPIRGPTGSNCRLKPRQKARSKKSNAPRCLDFLSLQRWVLGVFGSQKTANDDQLWDFGVCSDKA